MESAADAGKGVTAFLSRTLSPLEFRPLPRLLHGLGLAFLLLLCAAAASAQAQYPQALHPSMDNDATGSVFVPMDSWVIRARVPEAFGLFPTQSVRIRP